MRFALLALAALTACGAVNGGELIVEVDAEPEILARMRNLRIAVYDGDAELDATELTPTNMRPSCLPFSVGIAPRDTFAELPLGVVVTAELRAGPEVRKRVDTRLAPGTRLLSILLDASCASGCDRREAVEPPPAVDRDALRAELSRKECRIVPTPTECLNAGGCYDDADLSAPVCKSPCAARRVEPRPPEPPQPPAEPVAPELTPCPAGWSERPAERAGGPAVCEPWPAGQRSTCVRGEARFPGDPACAPLSACSAGTWPEDLPAGRAVLHVAPGAAPGGDGSSSAPLATIAEAVGRAAGGDVIALAAGAHTAGTLAIDRSVAIIGACASRTTVAAAFAVTAPGVELRAFALAGGRHAITASAPALAIDALELSATSSAALVISGGTASLTRVRIEGSRGYGLLAEAGATVTATAVEISGARGAAVYARDARVELTAIAIADVALAGDFGYGVRASAGASVHARALVLEGARGHGVLVENAPSYAAIERAILRDVGATARGTAGDAVRATYGASVLITQSAIERARNTGVFANTRAVVTARDLVVRDVVPSPLGAGVRCSSGCTLELERAALENLHHAALQILDGRATATDVDIFDVRATDVAPARTEGNGIQVGEVGTATVTRARIVNARVHAVLLLDRGSALLLQDATVRDTLQHGSSGRGFEAEAGTAPTIRRAVFINQVGVALRFLQSAGVPTKVVLEDLEVRETAASAPDADDGSAIYAGAAIDPDEAFPLALEVRRARLLRNRHVAIQLYFVSAHLEDVQAGGTEIGLMTRALGNGLSAFESEVTGARLAFDDNVDAGVRVEGARARATLEDLVVSDTTCNTELAFCGSNRGAGVAVQQNAYARLDRFRLDGNRLNGLQLNFQATADAMNGVISNHPTGAWVRAGDFDVQRIGVNVLFEENRANIAFGDEPF